MIMKSLKSKETPDLEYFRMCTHHPADSMVGSKDLFEHNYNYFHFNPAPPLSFFYLSGYRRSWLFTTSWPLLLIVTFDPLHYFLLCFCLLSIHSNSSRNFLNVFFRFSWLQYVLLVLTSPDLLSSLCFPDNQLRSFWFSSFVCLMLLKT